MVDNVFKTLDATSKSFLAVFLIKELGIGKAGTYDTRITGTNRLTAVFGLNVRDKAEAIHQVSGGIAHREILLIGLHRQNQALFGNGKVLFFKCRRVDNGPLCQRIGFID